MSEPTKQRDGDQRLPEVNDRPYVQDAVIADIESRKQIGVERYGIALQPMNGRNTVLDAYEEALDLTVYLKGLLLEREEMERKVDAVLASGDREAGWSVLAELSWWLDND